MKRTIIKLANMLLLSAMLVPCGCCDEPVDFSTKAIQDTGGAGKFTVINMATNDTLIVSGAITIGVPQTLNAKNGNVIKLGFTPNDKYKDYRFATIYTLPDPDKTEIKDQYQYEYVVNNLAPGNHTVTMSASYSQHDDHNNITISADGRFQLRVAE